ncbi:MAG: AAA family ATPase, partial [Anaerolineales bacterium]|nr:AAA family ATPase [Anaerolineales bacterium]
MMGISKNLTEKTALEFQLLGPPQMAWCGEPFNLMRRQARALLYKLATSQLPVSRDNLIGLFWPEVGEATARQNLSRLASYLRGQLPKPDILFINTTSIGLNQELAWSDALVFEELCNTEDPSDWEKAVALYRGPFLSGFTVSNNPDFDRWQSQSQYTYERQYLSALANLVCAKREQGSYSSAIRFAQEYLETDDLAEEIYRQLIYSYAASGARDAALRQYEMCAMVLERELGVEPLPETRAAYEAAREGLSFAEQESTLEPTWATLPSLELPLTGRQEAWRQLEQAYSSFQEGGVILISGEPGVGKSRLMQEFATAQSSLVLVGNSHTGSQALPYQPIIQALRQALPLRSQWEHISPIWLAETTRLLPELWSQFPDLPKAVDIETKQAQARLYEALLQVFRGLAASPSLLLCLDDVQWIDQATLGWLQFIVRRMAGSGVCILGTFRSQEAENLSAWKGELQRAGLATEIQLEGLTEMDVLDVLRQAGEWRMELNQLARRIHAATSGNVYFILETVRELVESGSLADPGVDLPLSRTVQETIQRRVERLPVLARQILEIASVLSPWLAFETISDASGRSDLEVSEGLDELVNHHLLLIEDEQMRFQHDLAREVVYQNTSPWRRRLLHRRAANTLTMFVKPENAELPVLIAGHYEAAGEAAQAVDYYWRAAKSAQELFAHQAAITHLEKAIALSADISTAKDFPAQLYESLGVNLAITGRFAPAEEAYRKALALGAAGERLWQADLQRKLAETLPPQNRAEEAIATYRTALASLEGESNVTYKRVRLNTLLGLLDALYWDFYVDEMAELESLTEALLEEVGTAKQKSLFYQRLCQVAMLQDRYQISAETLALGRQSSLYAQDTG